MLRIPQYSVPAAQIKIFESKSEPKCKFSLEGCPGFKAGR